MLLGRYPTDILPLLEDSIQDGDMVTIRQPVDFYGVNYYNPLRVAANTDPDSENPFEFLELVGYDRTDFGWPVVPDALREWLIILRARYRAALPPIMITESGCSYGMGPTPTASSTTRPASTTSTPTSAPSPPPSARASTSAATTPGR